jgi:hypothetical protein
MKWRSQCIHRIEQHCRCLDENDASEGHSVWFGEADGAYQHCPLFLVAGGLPDGKGEASGNVPAKQALVARPCLLLRQNLCFRSQKLPLCGSQSVCSSQKPMSGSDFECCWPDLGSFGDHPCASHHRIQQPGQMSLENHKMRWLNQNWRSSRRYYHSRAAWFQGLA